MKKLGVGVLGVGEMGRKHAENIRRLVPEAREFRFRSCVLHLRVWSHP